MAFIGMAEDYEEYKKSEEFEKKSANIISDINRIAYDNMEPVSEEDLLLLQESRTRHDPYIVYMHPDASFYDEYYNSDITEEDDIPYATEIRNMRRLYKNVPDYMEAIRIRDLYIEYLIDKYGGEEMFEIYLTSGKLKEYIPPQPLLSKNAEGYDLFLQGIYEDIYEYSELDMDGIREVADDITSNIDVDNIKIVNDVSTELYPLALMRYIYGDLEPTAKFTTQNNNINGVQLDDLVGMQRMFKGWYVGDGNNPEEEDETAHYFSKTEKAIRERINRPYSVPSHGLLTKLIETNGEYDMDEDEEDYNEMVIDPVTNVPMTKSELNKREFIRKAAQHGWSDIKLMRSFGVGSEYELRLLERRRKNNKISKKKAMSLMSEIAGEDINEIMSLSTLDELDSILFDD